MVKNDTLWFQEDTSWRKTTRHGAGKITLAEAIAFVNSSGLDTSAWKAFQ